VHGLGAAALGGVGTAAYATGLTWVPQLGVALGPPLSLATLCLVKAASSLFVFAVLFQKVRIPPCLAALGCLARPPRPRGGERERPFRELNSQLLKRLLFAKCADAAFGATLCYALAKAVVRSKLFRRAVVEALIAVACLGWLLVDVYGTFAFLGTTTRYVAYLWQPPDQRYDSDSDEASDDEEESDSDGSASDGDDDAAYNALLGKPAPSAGLPASYRWADPAYATHVELCAQPRPSAFALEAV